MLYDYQYDIAAMIALAFLLFIYFIRRSFSTRSNKIFVAVIFCDLIASVTDFASIFMISYPENYPIVLNIVICLMYLFSFNMLAVLLFMYIDAEAKIGKLRHFSHAIQVGATIFYAVVIFSSPWTHLVAYYDEDLNYCHGPMMIVLYVVSFLLFALEAIFFTIARKKFTRYQLIANITLITSMCLSVVFQMIFPRLLVCQMIMAIILYFIYIAYENPAHYTYRNTACLNRNAFFETIKYANWRKQVNSIYAIHLTDYEYIKYHLSVFTVDEISIKIAEFLSTHFGKQAFVVNDDLYLVLLPGRVGNRDESILLIDDFVHHSISLAEGDVMVNADTYLLTDIDADFQADELEQVIRYRMDHPEATEEKMDSKTLLDTVIQGNNHQRQMLHIIKRAIANDEFQVYYQPIYDINNKCFQSAEALLRLNDSELGFINPEELVRIAENNNLIDQVGDLIFNKVCRFIKEQNIEGLGVNYVEVNLSPLQCQDMQLVSRYVKIMDDYGIRPGQLNMEITETAEIRNEKMLRLNIEDFHRMSIAMSIDDYGSGFASADYLIRLPVKIVKIDKMILWNAMENPSAMIVLKNTIHMLHELNKEIVVEGVENDDMVKLLTELHCEFLQGYYYSKPIPEADYVEFLKQHK